jgi:predicted nucleic acid-binding protein
MQITIELPDNIADRLTLVTRNIKDFELCGIATINPFS